MKQKLSDILNKLKALEPQLQERYHVSRIGVFGSVARGDSTEKSDIDLYVELEKPLGFDFILLGDELEEALGAKVDIADREMLKRLWPYIQDDLIYA